MNGTNDVVTLSGSEIKFNIKLTMPNDLTMEKVEFSATFFTRPGDGVTIDKQAMTKCDDGSYNCVLDTAAFRGIGLIYCDVEVRLPDNDCADGYRTERVRVQTGEFFMR
ncbi:MAG: hypothetical protein ACI305_00365 [Lepagella sp.]